MLPVVAATAAASALHTWAHSMAMEWCDMPPDWIGLDWWLPSDGDDDDDGDGDGDYSTPVAII